MNNTTTEMKNTLKRINSRKTEAEEWISNLKHRIVEGSAVEQNLKKKKQSKIIRRVSEDFWDKKHTNIWITGVPEEETKEKGHKKILEEIRVENFPNVGKERVAQFQEMQKDSYRIWAQREILRHILINLTKIKYKEKYQKQQEKFNK